MTEDAGECLNPWLTRGLLTARGIAGGPGGKWVSRVGFERGP